MDQASRHPIAKDRQTDIYMVLLDRRYAVVGISLDING
jgi:hypothetical protein